MTRARSSLDRRRNSAISSTVHGNRIDVAVHHERLGARRPNSADEVSVRVDAFDATVVDGRPRLPHPNRVRQSRLQERDDAEMRAITVWPGQPGVVPYQMKG